MLLDGWARPLVAAILAKDQKTLPAAEVDYLRKAGGFVNTMDELTPKEKTLYDKLVGMGGQKVPLPNGRIFDPSGQYDRQFEALARALGPRDATAQA